MKYPVDLLNATALLIGDSWRAVTSVEESATDGWLRIRTPGRGNEAINVRSESILAFKAQAAAEGISTQALLLQICELYLASL